MIALSRVEVSRTLVPRRWPVNSCCASSWNADPTKPRRPVKAADKNRSYMLSCASLTASRRNEGARAHGSPHAVHSRRSQRSVLARRSIRAPHRQQESRSRQRPGCTRPRQRDAMRSACKDQVPRGIRGRTASAVSNARPVTFSSRRRHGAARALVRARAAFFRCRHRHWGAASPAGAVREFGRTAAICSIAASSISRSTSAKAVPIASTDGEARRRRSHSSRHPHSPQPAG